MTYQQGYKQGKKETKEKMIAHLYRLKERKDNPPATPNMTGYYSLLKQYRTAVLNRIITWVKKL